jgi:pilus assembly protein CpaF
VHANSVVDALHRVETLAAMSEVEIPFAALRDQVNTAMDIVVQLSRAADGTRRIVEVGYLTSRGREEFAVQTLTRFDPSRQRPDGGEGAFERFPVPAALATRLRQRGEEIPSGFVAQQPPSGGAATWS